MSETVSDLKSDLRVKMKALRQSLEPGDVLGAARSVCQRLADQGFFEGIGTACVYASTGKELGTEPIITDLIETGRRVCVPDWEGWRTGSGLRLLEILDPDELSTTGRIVPQPKVVEGRIVLSGDVDLFLVPGLAFDHSGNRLGMGGGFFDRLLSTAPPGANIVGLAYDFQILSALPRETHDIPMTHVVGPSLGVTGQVSHKREGTTQ